MGAAIRAVVAAMAISQVTEEAVIIMDVEQVGMAVTVVATGVTGAGTIQAREAAGGVESSRYFESLERTFDH